MDFDISIHTLKYFISVADIGSITSASEQLHITQPSLSRQISNLEEKLGVPLFMRVKGGVALTDAGKKFYTYAQEEVSGYDTFISKAYSLRDGVIGALKLAHQKSSQEIVIGFKREFQRRYPNVSIRNREYNSGHLLDKLRTDEYHGVFIYQSEISEKYSDIDYLTVGNLPNMLLVSRTSPLAKQDCVALAELKEQKFVMPNNFSGPCRIKEIIAHCKIAGFTPDISSNAENMLDIISDVVHFDGVAILPYVHNIEESGQVKYLELLDYPPKYPIAFAWKASNDNPVLAAYINFVRSVTAGLTDQYFYTRGGAKNYLLEMLSAAAAE